jgi:hypothetical protein
LFAQHRTPIVGRDIQRERKYSGIVTVTVEAFFTEVLGEKLNTGKVIAFVGIDIITKSLMNTQKKC